MNSLKLVSQTEDAQRIAKQLINSDELYNEPGFCEEIMYVIRVLLGESGESMSVYDVRKIVEKADEHAEKLHLKTSGCKKTRMLLITWRMYLQLIRGTIIQKYM